MVMVLKKLPRRQPLNVGEVLGRGRRSRGGRGRHCNKSERSERSEMCWWGEKRKHQKTPSLYRNKMPSTHGNDESGHTAHQTQPIKHSPMKHVSSNTAIIEQKIQNTFRQKQSNLERID